MDDMNKAGQLYDKAVHALKTKKRKLLSTGTTPQEVRQKVNEEMKSIKIHKGNLRALEHELESMNEEMVSDIDISDLEDTLRIILVIIICSVMACICIPCSIYSS